ncbi:PTS sugar transporter subunit IIA [Sphingomonas corticis]|jgi:PTS system nitrogen regulatory IIA component|uniref:PTS transporter subunit EIIA n=1 Tax=Sphingomonas corticis TaxID=2722791 RepID=A0ABX1CND6_9SPHN|nr:PTS sugar transporter subunit IIA [Sphingomonas corticis]NJR77600.1 PTS transporter subunit EIIA [Sphingomonas corticis]
MSTDLSDLVSPDLVVVGLPATTKKALFQQLGSLAAAATSPAPDARAVAEALAAREKQGSTGFGAGIALPHARLPGLPRIVAMVARLAQPIDMGAVDDQPVDVIVALLSPPDAGAAHLKALARVARRFRDPRFVAKVRGAGSRDAVYALLTADETRDAA